MKHLFKLKKKEYEEGARLALLNGKNHLAVAKAAANLQQFGIATSLLVIGLEELAKASVLKIKSIDNNIRINNLQDYFRKHDLKHETIYQLFFAAKITVSDNEDETEGSGETTKGSFQSVVLVILLIVIILGTAIYLIGKEEGENISNNENTSPLEGIRKSGFYLNFDSNNREWEYPNNHFTKAEYIEFEELVNLVFNDVEESLFKGKINKDNIIAFADALRNKEIITEHLKDLKEEIE